MGATPRAASGPRASIARCGLLVALAGAFTLCDGAGIRAQQPVATPTFRSGSQLVVVDVVARDRSGAPVRGLTADDFTVLEDGAPQSITAFDVEAVTAADPAAAPEPPAVSIAAAVAAESAHRVGQPEAMPAATGHRLVVLFFDLSSMQSDDVERAQAAALAYMRDQWTPSDLVSVASFSTSLRLDLDFTLDREQVLQAVRRLGRTGGDGFDAGATGDPDGTPDNGAAFTPDDTEFNIFNTDRRLDALQDLAEALGSIRQKKSVVYFSSGLSQTGQDNQVELRRTIDKANRANVSLYAADVRGLQALPAGGDATQASTRGTSLFSGAAARGRIDTLAGSQDTLTTLASDTGGRAFLDSNAFDAVFARVQSDTSFYYMIGYSSTARVADGRFRRITVKVRNPNVRLEYRSGYYAGRDFSHATKADREQQLQDQLLTSLSSTDLSVAASTAQFRVSDQRSYLSLSVVVPGAELAAAAQETKARGGLTLDIAAVVRDKQDRAVARVRDTVRVSADEVTGLARRPVQYQTGLELPPGDYTLKVVARENAKGSVGSYETRLQVGAYGGPVRVSSVVVGTALRPVQKGGDRSPLAKDGEELVQNATHVVSAGQPLLFHYEVYDAGRKNGAGPASNANPGAVKLLTSIAFFRRGVRVFETEPIEVTAVSDVARRAVTFQFSVSTASLAPGLYTCQVSIIDDVDGAFAFPRLQLYVVS